jgi:hypothetical protein
MSKNGRNFQAVSARALHRQITREQLVALGLSDQAIARREWLCRVHQGVHSVGGPPRTGLEHAAAALLAGGAGAGLCHDSAMCLHRMWTRWELPIHVAVPGDRRRNGIKIHRLHNLTEPDLVKRHGLKVTSPARTLLDMATRMTEKALARRVNEARRAGIVTLEDIADVVNRCPYHPGAKRLTPLLQLEGGPTRSEWEDAFPAFCSKYGLPVPVMSTRVAGYEADALWPQQRIVIELDSWEFHKDREQFESDRDRDVDRLVAGHVTVRVTWERIEHRSAREARRLHELVRQRTA